MVAGLRRVKSVEQSIRDTDEPEHRLKKNLSGLDLRFLIWMGVGVGVGVYFVYGYRRSRLAGGRGAEDAVTTAEPVGPGRPTPGGTPEG